VPIRWQQSGRQSFERGAISGIDGDTVFRVNCFFRDATSARRATNGLRLVATQVGIRELSGDTLDYLDHHFFRSEC
jgi:hypothetical protein